MWSNLSASRSFTFPFVIDVESAKARWLKAPVLGQIFSAELVELRGRGCWHLWRLAKKEGFHVKTAVNVCVFFGISCWWLIRRIFEASTVLSLNSYNNELIIDYWYMWNLDILYTVYATKKKQHMIGTWIGLDRCCSSLERINLDISVWSSWIHRHRWWSCFPSNALRTCFFKLRKT